MIYFLVNNDYQLLDARQHATSLKKMGANADLIEVPHNLRSTDRSAGFNRTFRLDSPVVGRRWFSSWTRYFSAARKVAATLTPTSNDTLIIYTEWELLNQLIAHHFKRAGATLYLIEDGGVATYIPFSLRDRETLTVKESIIAAMSRMLPSLEDSQFPKMNGIVFPWLADHLIDEVLLYRSVGITRKIPVRTLQREPPLSIVPVKGRVIFLNEALYENYLNFDQYIQTLDQIMSGLTHGFPEVFFKFHPREVDPWHNQIRSFLMHRYPSVHLIEERIPVESMLAEQRPEVIASYFSATLLNLGDSAIEPLFLYHLLPEVASARVFKQLSTLLNMWNYNFVTNWTEARSGYQSGLQTAVSTQHPKLADLLLTKHL